MRVTYIEGIADIHDPVHRGFEATYTRKFGIPPCAPCQKGSYKNEIGTMLPCKTCSAVNNSYCPSGAAVVACKMGFVVLPDGDQGSETQCVACTAGTYKDTTGATDQCTPCDDGTYEDAQASKACKICPLHSSTVSTASTALTECICLPGYTADETGVECQACAAGTFQDYMGKPSCKKCPGSS